jgi:AAA domain/Bifunctional DNA primase/polymerase, N-terminal
VRRRDNFALDTELFGGPVEPPPNGDTPRLGMTTGEALDLAETWAARGIGVFPIEISWDDAKGHTDKAPLTEHGFKDAATELRAVRIMFNMATPRRGGVLGVGLHLGPAGFLAVDTDGAANVAAFAERELPATYAPTTCSGSRHWWYRKPETVHVGNACDWPEVDVIRSDDGFVVAPGTFTPWGDWVSHDDFGTDVTEAPPELWLAIDHGGTAGTRRSSAVSDRGLDVVLHQLRADDRDQDAEALVVLCNERYGGHHPFMKADGEILVTRPGKRAGTSASVGYVAPGVVRMFSTDWPGLVNDHRYIVGDDGVLVDTDALEWQPPAADADGKRPVRTVRVTSASSIKPRPVRWLWQDRIPIGEVTLTPGRGGLGKSTFHAHTIAQITRGRLDGDCYGTPRPCIIAATEDSWARTIVPRLIVAGADLDLVYRVDVIIESGAEVSISLPADLAGLETEIVQLGVALLSVDPLLGVVHGTLDTHKDADVRRALQPLARLADRAGAAVLGNAHFNKSNGSDPLTLIMASAAFGNVARAALGFARDTDTEDGSCVISQVKNNLGRLDLPSLRYRIEGAIVATDEGPASVGRLVMLGESDRSVADILRGGNGDDERSELQSAKDFLLDVLNDVGSLTSEVEDRATNGHGFSKRTLVRARKELNVVAFQKDRKWYLRLPSDGQGATHGRWHPGTLTDEMQLP